MKRGGSLSFLVVTISNVLVMEIGWTDVGSGGYILVSCAHSNTCTSFNNRINLISVIIISLFKHKLHLTEMIQSHTIVYFGMGEL